MPDLAAASDAIDDRDVYAALVPGRQLRIVDVRPLPADDARGLCPSTWSSAGWSAAPRGDDSGARQGRGGGQPPARAPALMGAVIGGAFLVFALLGWGDVDVAVAVALAMFASCSIATMVAMALPAVFQRLGGTRRSGQGRWPR